MNWTAPEVVVCAAEPGCVAEAKNLAHIAGLRVIENIQEAETATKTDSSSWTLLVQPSELSLRRPDGLSIEIDFIHGKGIRRAQEANFKSQPLARALGLQKLRKHHDQTPTVIDATAGFGTDGWMIASLGCEVRLLEASPVLATMLTHALENARNTAATAAMHNRPENQSVNSPAQNISVFNTDSIQYLNDNENASADIIYLDPMYPQTRSKALVKKGMQLLHDLIGPDNNSADLLGAALNRANYRVIVKRPRGAPTLNGTIKFSGQLSAVQSTNTRYDIYHTFSL